MVTFDSWESYFYPDTIDPDTGIGTLRNLYEERDARVLSRMEYTDTTVRAVQVGNGEVEIPRTFDGAHLRAIHGHLFQDVYEWAGEYRTVEMSKGPGRGFGEVRSGEVDRYLSDARQLVTSTDWAKIGRNDFIATASTVFAYVNQAHPFREGNGRTSKVAAAMALGQQFLTPQSLAQSLHPALIALSHEADELVHLGVLIGDQVMYVDKVEPERAIRVWSQVGQRTSAASSAMGRALLAFRDVPDDQLAAYLHNSTVTLPQLIAAVHATRERGYSTELEENEPGVACLGTAVMQGPSPVAALSITMPAERLTTARQQALSNLIREVLPPLLPEGLSLPVQ